MRLGGNGSEDAVLVEAHAIGAPAVVGGLKSRASNLGKGEWLTEQLATRRELPCVSCSNDRQWRFAGVVRAAGDVGSCRREVVAGRGTDLGAGALDSIREGLADGGAAGAGGGGVEPCRGEGPVVVVQEEGEMWQAGGGGSRVSMYKRQAWVDQAIRLRVWDLHEEAEGRSRVQAVAR